MPDEGQQQVKKPSTPLYKSKTFMTMSVFTVVGAVMWGYAAVTAPQAPPAAAASSGVNQSLVQGFAAGEQKTGANDGAPPAEPEKRLIDNAPRMFTIGLSFVGGFLLAWGMRKFIKWPLLLAGLAVGGVFLLKKYGISDVGGIQTEDIEQHVDQGVTWAKEHGNQAVEYVKQYLPSSASGVVGMFFGARKD